MIEDVDYLLENSEKDSIPFFIDSTTRNRTFYPAASEYQITFPMPFRQVIGFDILDATIPTTMYNVDLYNDKIAISTIANFSLAAVNVKPWDYFTELAGSKIFGTIFDDTSVALSEIVVTQEANVATNLIPDAQRLNNTYKGGGQYFIAVRYVMNNVPLIVPLSDNDPNIYYVMIGIKKYGLQRVTANQPTIDILDDDNYYLTQNAGTFKLTYFKFYNSSATALNGLTNASNCIARIYNYYKDVERGNYDITLFRQYLFEQWKENGIKVEPTTTVDRKQGKFKLTSNEVIIFNARKSTCAANIGFETMPNSEESGYYGYVNVRDNAQVFYSNQQDADSQWILYPPGLVNLLGERYVILRCKEIEDHLLGSFAYMNFTPGVGMFKLAAANDITNLRFDFVSLVRKPFHPIGKLNRLTFRFETSSGKLYDFKGINHQILMMIKFLVPVQKSRLTRSVLNPNYDPDFVRYMSKNKTIAYKEDSDHEEEFDRQRYYEIYKRAMDKYGDEESEDDEEEDVPLSAPRIM